jgi:hypothetical protein
MAMDTNAHTIRMIKVKSLRAPHNNSMKANFDLNIYVWWKFTGWDGGFFGVGSKFLSSLLNGGTVDS